MQRDTAYADQKLSQRREKEEMLDGQISSLMEEIRQKREQGDHSLQETYAQILDHLETSLVQVRQTINAQEKVIDEHRERLKQAVKNEKLSKRSKKSIILSGNLKSDTMNRLCSKNMPTPLIDDSQAKKNLKVYWTAAPPPLLGYPDCG